MITCQSAHVSSSAQSTQLHHISKLLSQGEADCCTEIKYCINLEQLYNNCITICRSQKMEIICNLMGVLHLGHTNLKSSSLTLIETSVDKPILTESLQSCMFHTQTSPRTRGCPSPSPWTNLRCSPQSYSSSPPQKSPQKLFRCWCYFQNFSACSWCFKTY